MRELRGASLVQLSLSLLLSGDVAAADAAVDDDVAPDDDDGDDDDDDEADASAPLLVVAASGAAADDDGEASDGESLAFMMNSCLAGGQLHALHWFWFLRVFDSTTNS